MGTILNIASVIEVFLWLIRKTIEAERRAVQRAIAEFNAAHPPMSDDEFLARCSPNVRPDIALRVRAVVSVSLGIEYDRVYPDTKFIECC